MNDAAIKKLTDACDAAYKAHRTSCSHAVTAVIRAIHDSAYEHRAANELIDWLSRDKEWNGISLEEGFTAAKDLMERIREGFDNPKAGSKEQLLLGYGQAVEAQADYVEAVFKYLLTLGALERVTAGGVRPAFPGR